MNNFKKFTTVSAGIALSALAVPFSLYAGHTNTVLEAELDGKQEVASSIEEGKTKPKKKVGDKNGKGEAYVFGIDGALDTLCYVLEVEKIQLVGVADGMAAHIHKGAEGENGPVVAKLAGPEDGNAADCIDPFENGDKFPMYPMVSAQDILEHPEEYYVNVHNPEYPAGAIRGQLEYQLDEDEDDDHDDK